MIRKPETMVLAAWSITITVFLSAGWLVGNWTGAGEKITIPYFELTIAIQAYFVSLVVILASIATALALGLKKLLPAFLLALPGGLFMWFALAVAVFSGKFIDERHIIASVLFFPFCATGGSLLIRSRKDEGIRRKIYLGALLLMALLTASAFLLFLLL
jgi:hypothetical protein